MIGKKDEKIDKEKEEYFLAKLKYDDNAVKIEEEEERELDRINARLRQYDGVDRKYEETLKQKEILLIKDGKETGINLKNEFLKRDEFNNLCVIPPSSIGGGWITSFLFRLDGWIKKVEPLRYT